MVGALQGLAKQWVIQQPRSGGEIISLSVGIRLAKISVSLLLSDQQQQACQQYQSNE